MRVIPFQPPQFGTNPHYQTIIAVLLSQMPGNKSRNIIASGEAVKIPTQCDTNDVILAYIHRTPRATENTPAVVLLHGLEGSSESIYMLEMCRKLLNAGFHVIRMNLRSCGNGVNMAQNVYNSGMTIDLETVMEYCRKHVSPLIAVSGFSMGANVVLKYLGEDRDERNRQRAVLGAPPKRGKIKDRIAQVFTAVSPPLDLKISCEKLDSPGARIYRDRFLMEFKQRIKQGKFKHIPNAEQESLHVDNWFDFDHIYVAPSAGFVGANEYHAHCSSKLFVPHIKIPGLLLHAQDDPIIDPGAWLNMNWDGLPHLTTHLTALGGHVGWYAKHHALHPDHRWMDYRLMKYLMEWKESLKIKPRGIRNILTRGPA